MSRKYETTFFNLAIIYLLIVLAITIYILENYIIIDCTLVAVLLFITPIPGALLSKLTIFIYDKIKRKMEQKTIKIEVPEGYEIDREKSTFENIVLKPIPKIRTWNDLIQTPLKGKYFINQLSTITEVRSDCLIMESRDKNLLPNKEYAEAMLALCQLLLVRSYYIGNWKPNYKDGNPKYVVYVRYDYNAKDYTIDWESTRHSFRVLTFPSVEMTQEFIKNNEKLILKAKLVL